jgi:hypothetical protein
MKLGNLKTFGNHGIIVASAHRAQLHAQQFFGRQFFARWTAITVTRVPVTARSVTIPRRAAVTIPSRACTIVTFSARASRNRASGGWAP